SCGVRVGYRQSGDSNLAAVGFSPASAGDRLVGRNLVHDYWRLPVRDCRGKLVWWSPGGSRGRTLNHSLVYGSGVSEHGADARHGRVAKASERAGIIAAGRADRTVIRPRVFSAEFCAELADAAGDQGDSERSTSGRTGDRFDFRPGNGR